MYEKIKKNEKERLHLKAFFLRLRNFFWKKMFKIFNFFISFSFFCYFMCFLMAMSSFVKLSSRRVNWLFNCCLEGLNCLLDNMRPQVINLSTCLCDWNHKGGKFQIRPRWGAKFWKNCIVQVMSFPKSPYLLKLDEFKTKLRPTAVRR